MSVVKRETIEKLIDQTADINLSIFIPTHVRGEEGKQDHIRFKNTLQKIRRDLQDKEWKENEIDALFKGTEDLINDKTFWLHQNNGLVLYMNKNYFEYFKIPITPEENYYLAENFLITPLMELQNHHEVYHILALSQEETRLYKVTPEQISKVDLGDVATSMDKHLQFHEMDAGLQQHAGTPQRTGSYHGQGPEFHEDKEMTIFLKHIENKVTKALHKDNSPLLLAGLDKMISYYKKINHYKNTLDECMAGNVDRRSPEDLNEEAWKCVEPYFRKEIDKQKERFYNLNGNGTASTELSEIVKGAYYGQVEVLFLPIGHKQWGVFDKENDTVYTSETPTAESCDLINYTAINAIRNGSTLYGLQPDEMPSNAHLAAILRYKM